MTRITETEVEKAKRQMRERLVVCDEVQTPHSYAVCSCTQGHKYPRQAFELTCPCARCLEHVPTTRVETGFAGETEQLCELCLSITNSAVALGKVGGKVKSAAKTKAARKNGKLGGRPKGKRHDQRSSE